MNYTSSTLRSPRGRGQAPLLGCTVLRRPGASTRDGGTPLERAILEALDEPRTTSGLCAALAWSPREAAAALLRLEARGYVDLVPSGEEPTAPLRADIRLPEEPHNESALARASTLTESELRGALDPTGA